jgi:hypothetical protein
MILENLPDLYRGRESMEAWEKMSIASTIGGMVINTAGVTLAHGMEHPVSGLKNVVHGTGPCRYHSGGCRGYLAGKSVQVRPARPHDGRLHGGGLCGKKSAPSCGVWTWKSPSRISA